MNNKWKLELNGVSVDERTTFETNQPDKLFKLADARASMFGEVPTITDPFGVQWMRVEDAT